MSIRPLARCREYTEDGRPIGAGCTVPFCRFVHPDSAAWKNAPLPRSRLTSMQQNHVVHKGRSRALISSKPNTSNDGTWDVTSWSTPASASTPTTGRTSRHRESVDPSFGSSSAASSWGANATSRTAVVGNMHGWGGNKSPPAPSSQAWSDNKPPPASSSHGWGERKSPPASSTHGWGNVSPTTRSPLGWASGAWGGPSSPPRTKSHPSNTPNVLSSTLTLKGNQAQAFNPNGERNMAMDVDQPVLSSKLALTQRVASQHIPLPRLKHSRLRETKTARLASQSSSIKPKPFPSQFQGPKGRALLYTTTIKHMQTAVRLGVKNSRAAADLDRWKVTQSSSIYAHAPHAARQRLDVIRANYTQVALVANQRFKSALRALLNLPDLTAAHADDLHQTSLDQEKIRAYIAELEARLVDIERHHTEARKRRARVEDEKRAQAEAVKVAAQNESHSSARELLERGRWEWKEVKEALASVHEKLDVLRDQVHAVTLRSRPEIRKNIVDHVDPVRKEVQRRLVESASKVNRMGEVLTVTAGDATELILRIKSLMNEREQREREIQEVKDICSEADKYFEQYEEWKKEDEKRIQYLTCQIQNLDSSPSLSISQQFTEDDVKTHVKTYIKQCIEEEIIPVLGQMMKNSEQSQADIKAEVMRKLVPITQTVNRMVKYAEENDNSVAV